MDKAIPQGNYSRTVRRPSNRAEFAPKQTAWFAFAKS
jgi:hypothetical protein